ncbi:hypothetical protein [Robertkochia sediminum]|nr:hypothetical protein [Robertkochia sediminum]MBL7472097.1 hypothetical protein [Robertkochia sediminum]
MTYLQHLPNTMTSLLLFFSFMAFVPRIPYTWIRTASQPPLAITNITVW